MSREKGKKLKVEENKRKEMDTVDYATRCSSAATTKHRGRHGLKGSSTGTGVPSPNPSSPKRGAPANFDLSTTSCPWRRPRSGVQRTRAMFWTNNTTLTGTYAIFLQAEDCVSKKKKKGVDLWSHHRSEITGLTDLLQIHRSHVLP
jgi:hypothetical protein